jgi:hypothetical protein
VWIWSFLLSPCGGLAGFVGELENGVDGGVLGGVVALHVLPVLGSGVAVAVAVGRYEHLNL